MRSFFSLPMCSLPSTMAFLYRVNEWLKGPLIHCHVTSPSTVPTFRGIVILDNECLKSSFHVFTCTNPRLNVDITHLQIQDASVIRNGSYTENIPRPFDPFNARQSIIPSVLQYYSIASWIKKLKLSWFCYFHDGQGKTLVKRRFCDNLFK